MTITHIYKNKLMPMSHKWNLFLYWHNCIQPYNMLNKKQIYAIVRFCKNWIINCLLIWSKSRMLSLLQQLQQVHLLSSLELSQSVGLFLHSIKLVVLSSDTWWNSIYRKENINIYRIWHTFLCSSSCSFCSVFFLQFFYWQQHSLVFLSLAPENSKIIGIQKKE